MQKKSTHTVAKETLSQLSFMKDDVLGDSLSKQVRQFNLKRAQTLGNGYRQKVKIVFITENQEVQKVETTVWSVGNYHVSLKDGIRIPINAITEIEF